MNLNWTISASTFESILTLQQFFQTCLKLLHLSMVYHSDSVVVHKGLLCVGKAAGPVCIVRRQPKVSDYFLKNCISASGVREFTPMEVAVKDISSLGGNSYRTIEVEFHDPSEAPRYLVAPLVYIEAVELQLLCHKGE